MGGHMKKEKYYAAYGSNLSVEQMAHRCPQAKIAGTGVLENYELQFKGTPGNAHATVEVCAGKTVPVLIWSLTDQDEMSLDRYEGYPSYYGKQTCKIEADGQSYEVMFYEMQPDYHLNIPSPGYFNVIRDGYRHFGFPEEILEEALMKSVMPLYDKLEVQEEMEMRL